MIMNSWSTDQDINKGSHCEDKSGVQVRQKVSLRWENREEKAAKREAGEIWDEHWYWADQQVPVEDHSWLSALNRLRAGCRPSLFPEKVYGIHYFEHYWLLILNQVAGGSI